MIYIIKQEGLYQKKVNPCLVFTSNCKMGYSREILKQYIPLLIGRITMRVKQWERNAGLG